MRVRAVPRSKPGLPSRCPQTSSLDEICTSAAPAPDWAPLARLPLALLATHVRPLLSSRDLAALGATCKVHGVDWVAWLG